MNHASIVSATCSGVPAKVQVPASAAEPPDQLPHGEPFAPGQLDDERVAALGALDGALRRQVGGQLGVQLQGARLQLQQAAPAGATPCVYTMWSSRTRSAARASASVEPITGTMPGSTLMCVGVAAGRRRTGLEVGVEGLRVLEGLLGGEHRLRVPGRERLAVLGRTRPARAAGNPAGVRGTLSGALDAEVRPLVPGRVDLRVVAPRRRTPCRRRSRRPPSCPRACSATSRNSAARAYRSACAGSASRPKLRAASAPGGGDDVPAGPAAADDVERGELAGQVVGRVVGGGGGGDQADVLGGRRQRGQQGERLEGAGRALGRRCPTAAGRRRGRASRSVPRSAIRARLDVVREVDVARTGRSPGAATTPRGGRCSSGTR